MSRVKTDRAFSKLQLIEMGNFILIMDIKREPVRAFILPERFPCHSEVCFTLKHYSIYRVTHIEKLSRAHKEAHHPEDACITNRSLLVCV